MKRLIITYAFLFTGYLTWSQVLQPQDQRVLFHGLVMDANTLTPLANTQIIINSAKFSLSDKNGVFAFYVFRNDTIEFHSLGYKPSILNVSDTLKGNEFITGIFMQSDTLSIGEVIIVPRLVNLRSEMLSPKTPSNAQIENAKYNVALSGYQGRMSQNKLGDPSSNYEYLRQKQRVDASEKGGIPSDRMVGLSPFLLVPAAYLLINGFPEKPESFSQQITEQEVQQIHKQYLESLNRKK